MKTLVMSSLYTCFCEALRQKGYNIIPTKNINVFHKPEQRHADMQLLKIRERVFTLCDCRKKVGKCYPENVLLNCLYLGNKLYGRLDAVDPVVPEYCAEHGIETVNVKQGYARCSTLVINENAAVTADKSIEKALKNNGVKVLLISPGHIRLEGFNYGFIGGAGFSDNGKTFFFGDITKHPDFNKIKAFCDDYNSKLEILCNTEPLTDIGGVVITED